MQNNLFRIFEQAGSHALFFNKVDIEISRQEQKYYEEWAKGAELRKEITLAILDKCNGQVKKMLFAKHTIDQIEYLTCSN